MMKKNAIALVSMVLFTGCFSYKNTMVENLEKDKYYEMVLNNNMNVKGEFNTMSTDSVEFKIKTRLLRYAKNDIHSIKRRKTSVIKSLGVFAVMSAGMVISVTTNETEKASDAFWKPRDN